MEITEEEGQENNGEPQPSQTIDQFIAENYPLPGSKDTPLKINAEDLDYLILIPKGVTGGAPAGQEEPPQAPPKAEMSNDPPKEKPASSEISPELQKQLDESQTQLTALQEQIDTLETERKNSLVEGIVSERLSKKHLKEADADETRANLSKMDAESLKVVLKDTQSLPSMEVGKPQPKTSGKKAELSENELKKAELRKELFGHEETIEVKLSQGVN